jgi:hypothetical protein
VIACRVARETTLATLGPFAPGAKERLGARMQARTKALFSFSGNARDLSGGSDALIGSESTLITDLNSLQGREKNPLFGCVGNWLVKS